MKTIKKMIWALVIILGIFVIINIVVYIFTHQKNFGSIPKNERLERVKQSPHYSSGEFRNLMLTPQLTEGVKMIDLPIDMIFKKHERIKPVSKIPSIKVDLKNIDPRQDILLWLGHSSYFIQIDGKRILVDPVLCGNAAPVSFMMKAFNGADIYKAEDIPEIDYLFITHDHWDHLDYETVMMLESKIGKIVCGLGVGEHFSSWGFDMSKVTELDWDEESVIDNGFQVYCLPTRHFSGRSQARNKAIWASYLLHTPSMKIYMGGDGGYGEHFAKIGERFGDIDIALLENGQYNYKWKYIHTMPEQVIQAAMDLRAKSIIPGHSGKFALASHPWDEPLIRISAAFEEIARNPANSSNLRLLTPKIGEIVFLKDSTQTFNQWWVGLE